MLFILGYSSKQVIPIFSQAWRDYIDANAKFKFYRYVKAQQKNKLPLLHSAVGEFLS